MAITWNDLVDFQHIYTASNGGTVFSANQAMSIAFDLFTDTAQVNDAIYFGFEAPRMLAKGVQFNIGTALAASGITIVWEYSRGSGTWAILPNVIDGTTNFTVTGQREVNWDWPTLAVAYNVVNDQYCDFIRCRITAISDITEGGAQSTQKVQARSGAIPVSEPGGAVISFCDAIYAADVAGGWGVVKKQGASQFYFNCHLFLGYTTDANSTTITETLKFMEFDGLIWGRINYCFVILGVLIDQVNKSTANGCALLGNKKLTSMFADSYNVIFKAYNTLLDYQCYSLGECYNIIKNKTSFIGPIDDSGNGPLWSNVSINGIIDAGAHSLAPNADISNIICYNRADGPAIRFTYETYLWQTKILDALYVGYCDISSSSTDSVMIDTEVPSDSVWAIRWLPGLTNRGPKISRCYSLNILVSDTASLPIVDTAVAIFDNNGNGGLWVESGRCNALSSSDTTMTVNTDVFAINDNVKMGVEIIKITGGSYPTYTISRAQLNTEAVAHSSRQIFRQYPVLETDVNGATDEVIVETHNYKWLSGDNPGVSAVSEYNPFILTLRKYGYLYQEMVLSVNGPIQSSYILAINQFVAVDAATAGAYTGIVIDPVALTVTVTAAHTMQEMYDYSQWWASQTGNMQYPEPITTVDGINFALPADWDIIIDGVTVSAVGKVVTCSGTGTYSVINGGDFTGVLTATTHTRVKITAPNLIDGTRVYVINDTLGVEVDNSVVAGGAGYVFVADIPSATLAAGNLIMLFATYCSGLTAKRELFASGLMTTAGLQFVDTQEDWQEYIDMGIDGSTVTEFVADYPNIEVDINDPDNVTTKQRLIAWWIYNLTTADGIRFFFEGITVEDVSNYRINDAVTNFYLDNLNAIPLKFTDSARLYKANGGTVIAATSNSIQLDSGKVYVVNQADILLAISEIPTAEENAEATMEYTR